MKYWQKVGDAKTAVMKFYGEISVWFNGANDFTSTMQEIEAAYERLEIKVHCYGGQVFEGNVIFNAIRNSKLDVEIIIDGVAASMMSIVMLAAKKVTIAENGFIMIHVPSGYTAGNANDHFATAKLLKSMQANFSREYIRKTGKNNVDAWFDGSDHWFDAAEAKALGLVDEIAAPVAVAASNLKPDTGTAMQSVFDRYTSLIKQPAPSSNLKINNMREQILKLLGLPDTATDEEIVSAVAALVGQKETATEKATNMLAVAVSKGRMDKNTESLYAKIVGTDPSFVIDKLFEMSVTPAAVPQLLDLISGKAKNVANTQITGFEDRTKWGLEDYRKNAPNELKNNNALYENLLRQEGITE